MPSPRRARLKITVFFLSSASGIPMPVGFSAVCRAAMYCKLGGHCAHIACTTFLEFQISFASCVHQVASSFALGVHQLAGHSWAQGYAHEQHIAYNSNTGLLCFRLAAQVANSLNRALCIAAPFKLAWVLCQGLSVAWPQACMHRHARNTYCFGVLRGASGREKRWGPSHLNPCSTHPCKPRGGPDLALETSVV